MQNPEPTERKEAKSDDLGRATEQLTARLSALGIAVDGSESPELLVEISDAVERFEDAVEASGGDLMVDEPPAGSTGQPDDPDFILPRRLADETPAAYIERLDFATDRVLSRRKPA